MPNKRESRKSRVTLCVCAFSNLSMYALINGKQRMCYAHHFVADSLIHSLYPILLYSAFFFFFFVCSTVFFSLFLSVFSVIVVVTSSHVLCSFRHHCAVFIFCFFFSLFSSLCCCCYYYYYSTIGGKVHIHGTSVLSKIQYSLLPRVDQNTSTIKTKKTLSLLKCLAAFSLLLLLLLAALHRFRYLSTPRN